MTKEKVQQGNNESIKIGKAIPTWVWSEDTQSSQLAIDLIPHYGELYAAMQEFTELVPTLIPFCQKFSKEKIEQLYVIVNDCTSPEKVAAVKETLIDLLDEIIMFDRRMYENLSFYLDVNTQPLPEPGAFGQAINRYTTFEQLQQIPLFVAWIQNQLFSFVRSESLRIPPKVLTSQVSQLLTYLHELKSPLTVAKQVLIVPEYDDDYVLSALKQAVASSLEMHHMFYEGSTGTLVSFRDFESLLHQFLQRQSKLSRVGFTYVTSSTLDQSVVVLLNRKLIKQFLATVFYNASDQVRNSNRTVNPTNLAEIEVKLRQSDMRLEIICTDSLGGFPLEPEQVAELNTTDMAEKILFYQPALGKTDKISGSGRGLWGLQHAVEHVKSDFSVEMGTKISQGQPIGAIITLRVPLFLNQND